MRVRCVKYFRDFEGGTYRNVGDTFEVSEERFNAINSAGYGQLVEGLPEETNGEDVSTEKPKRGRPRRKVTQ